LASLQIDNCEETPDQKVLLFRIAPSTESRKRM